MKITSIISGDGPDFYRGRWARRWSASTVEKLAAAAGCRIVLHMGSLGTPVSGGTKLRHYIYLDSTYRLLTSYGAADRFRNDFEVLEKAALERAECVFTTSEYVRDNVIANYGVRPDKVINAGTGRGGIAPLDRPKQADNYQILFVAKARFEQKGGRLLLDGFRVAHERHPKLRLVMVAPKEYRELVEACPGAEFRTDLSWSELENLFHESILYAMPAPYEPWGLVYLEALASRCALLGMNRNALPEFTQNGRFGILIDEPTAEAVASGLLEAFREPGRLVQMGEEGQRHCMSRYSWQRTVKIMASYFEAEAKTLSLRSGTVA
jgi:glycosyltransferase involved in cell wall biosynthesis